MAKNSSRIYDFIVTGASGNVGRCLVPILAERGNRVLVVGRDLTALRALFARLDGVDTTDYAGLADQHACHTLVHLAVLNNNQTGSREDFIKVNVDFAARICENFNRMGGYRFINIASIHSLDPENTSYYAISKGLAQKTIRDMVGHRLDNIHIGYFHGDRYYGERLRFLCQAGKVGRVFFGLFKILKSTTSASSLADYVLGPVDKVIPAILTDDLSRSPAYRLITRTVDVLVAIGILALLLPVLIVVWAAIRLDSPGPAIFAQTRVGKEQSLFTLYKFRTMKRGTATVGTHEISVSAVTKIGKFLRGTKLDELPQAINLLRGEMTLVGPRPCLPVQEELVNARKALGVCSIKPGITGSAQIRNIDMSRPQELARIDYIYMKLQSLTLNFKILLLTASGRGRGDRVDVRKTL